MPADRASASGRTVSVPDKKEYDRHHLQPELCQAHRRQPEYICLRCITGIVTALAIAGDLTFNPLTDALINEEGKEVRLDPPHGDRIASDGI